MEKTNNLSRVIIIIFGIIGFLDAAYLSYIKIANTPIYCTPGLGECDVVNSSPYSYILGIPIAFFGLAAFAAILLIMLLHNKVKFIDSYADLIIFGISLFGFLFSLFLTYLELFVIHAICQWCVLSAISITTIFIASIVKLVKQPVNE